MTTVIKDKNQNLWFKEWLSPHETHSHHIKRILVNRKTKFQKVMIADTFSFGRCLILDGEIQSSQWDEFVYHECLVHPALMAHPQPKNVLILGGGEGATSREVLRHKTVKQVTLVDIDGDVVKLCQTYLPSWHQGIFRDSRHHLHIDDAKKFIQESNNKYDVIISDLPSPAETGPATQLYTREFLKVLVERLYPDGVFVMQAGPGNFLDLDLHKVLFSTLKRVFKIVRSLYAYIPSFDGPWSFVLGSTSVDPLELTDQEVDRRLRNRLKGSLRYYDGLSHKGLFHLPKFLRNILHKESRTFIGSKPIYLFSQKMNKINQRKQKRGGKGEHL